MRIAMTAVVAVTLLASGCTQKADRRATPTPTAGTGLTQRCMSPSGGYRVGYPEGWHVNDPEAAEPCRWFQRERFVLPQDTEPTGIAISIGVERTAFATVRDGTVSGPHVIEVVSRRDVEVAGRPGLRAETVSSGQGLYDTGTRITTYVADWNGGALVASTTSAATGTYDDNVAALDRMLVSLQRADRTCSASVLEPGLAPQPDLPEPVATMRQSIARAAAACDHDELARLALAGGTTFTYSFGDRGDPAAFWRSQESDPDGPRPLLFLLGVLKRMFAMRAADDATQYVWPSAYVHRSWSAVPEAERDALEPLYGDADMSRFERFGSYAGYRAGITASGDWLYFVSGD